jgi:glycosyltransferase involved in cell wall biosynthesis
VRRPGEPVELLFFGVIRPHKGLDDLVDAFAILRDGGVRVRLTVAGEVWQSYDAPLVRLESGAHAGAVRIERGYVPDSAVPGLFERADLLVAPYRRASASGPLAIAIARGMPVVVSDVPALAEVACGYAGAVLAPPSDPAGLAAAIRRALPLAGSRHRPAGSWRDASAAVSALLDEVAPARRRDGSRGASRGRASTVAAGVT